GESTAGQGVTTCFTSVCFAFVPFVPLIGDILVSFRDRRVLNGSTVPNKRDPTLRGKTMPETTEAYDFRGRTIVDREGEKVGKIDELYYDHQGGQPEWALVS